MIDFVRRAGEVRIQRRREAAEKIRRDKEEAARREEELRLRPIREEEERVRREQELELDRRSAELRRGQQAEQARIETLIGQATAWHRSQSIRSYIVAVREAAIRRNGRIDEGTELSQWLEWASRQADRIDPLVPNPPSILDETL